MEVSATAIAVGVGVLLIGGYLIIKSNAESQAAIASANVAPTNSPRSGLESGSVGDVLFGIIGGLGTAIGVSVAAANRNSGGQKQGTTNSPAYFGGGGAGFDSNPYFSAASGSRVNV